MLKFISVRFLLIVIMVCFPLINAMAGGKECILSDSITLVIVYGKAMGTVIDVAKDGKVSVCKAFEISLRSGRVSSSLVLRCA